MGRDARQRARKSDRPADPEVRRVGEREGPPLVGDGRDFFGTGVERLLPDLLPDNVTQGDIRAD